MDEFGRQLENLDAADVLISTTLSASAVDVSLSVPAIEFSDAIATADSTLATPGWSYRWVEVKASGSAEQVEQTAEEEELVGA